MKSCQPQSSTDSEHYRHDIPREKCGGCFVATYCITAYWGIFPRHAREKARMLRRRDAYRYIFPTHHIRPISINSKSISSRRKWNQMLFMVLLQQSPLPARSCPKYMGPEGSNGCGDRRCAGVIHGVKCLWNGNVRELKMARTRENIKVMIA